MAQLWSEFDETRTTSYIWGMVTAHRDRSVFRATAPTPCLHIDRLFSDLDFVQGSAKVRVFLKADLDRYRYLVDRARTLCEQLVADVDNITIVKTSGFITRPMKNAWVTCIRYQYGKTRMTRESASIGNIPDESVDVLVLSEESRVRARQWQMARNGTTNIEVGDFLNLLPWI